MFFYLDGEKWKIMKSGKKDSNDNGTIKKKKNHKKKEVKRRETKEARREKKKRKRKISRQYRGKRKLRSNWEQISGN